MRMTQCFSSLLFLLSFCCLPVVLAETLLDEATPIFITVRLPHGLSVEVPRSWRVRVGHTSTDLELGAATTLDLSRMEIPADHTLLRATATPADRPASISIAYLPQSTVSRADMTQLSPAALAEYDNGLRHTVETQLRARGVVVLEWTDTRQEQFASQAALVSEYQRKTQQAAVFKEQVNLIPRENGAVLFLLAYNEQAGDSWRSMAMRIRASCKIDEGKAR